MTQSTPLPEGFKLISRRGRRSRDAELKKAGYTVNHYAVSEKGQILHLESGITLVAPEGSNTITHRVEEPGHTSEVTFDIPILLEKYFGEGADKGLSQEDFDELVKLSGLPPTVCRARLDDGWAFEITDGEAGKWIKADD